MGMLEVIQGAAATAFTAVGNVVERVTYERRTGGTFTPGSGMVATRDQQEVGCIFADFTTEEMAVDGVMPEDRKALILGTALAFRPSRGDRIVRADGETWDVVNATTDPATALWQIQTRRPS